MTVVPFSRCRFTPADLETFMSYARPSLEKGWWEKVERHTDGSSDQLVAVIGSQEVPFLSFKRDAGGRYSVSIRVRTGWCDIFSGDSADECLRGMLPKATA